ncbi:MAG: hypothetical protein ACHQRM_14040, partial [Bacteroidia bacterium]
MADIHFMPGHIQAFEENKGQFLNPVNDWKVLYGCNSGGTQILFSDKGLIYSLPEKQKNDNHEGEEKEEEAKHRKVIRHPIAVAWEQINPGMTLEAEEETPYYFCSSKALEIKTSIDHIKGYKKLIYRNIEAGMDLEFTFHTEQGIKYAIHVQPGVDAGTFTMHYSGQQKLDLDVNGNLHIHTAVGDMIDHAPVTKLNDGTPVASAFEKLGENRVHFKLAATPSSTGLTIDPWTVNPTNPPGSTDFAPVDIGMDAADNTYIMGMDNNYLMYVQKYDPSGILKWSYTLNEYSGSDLSDLTVDPAGNTYVASPYSYSNSNFQQYAMVSLDANGSRRYFYNTYNNSDVYETWVLAYSCNYSTLIQAGAYTVGQMQAAVMNPSNGTIGALNTTSTVGEIIAGTVAPNNLFYALAANGSNGRNAVACFSFTSGTISYNWAVDPGYTFSDFSPKMNFSAIPTNGIAAGCSYLYTSDGKSLDQRSLANGSLVRRITIPGGTNSGSNINSGLAVDLSCGYVYAGSANNVHCYDANLNLVHTYSGLPGIVADVTLNNGLISCCGAPSGGSSPGFVAQFPAQTCGSMITLSETDANCGASNGTATATASFCTGPYTYLWSPGGQTTQTATGLAAGTYTVQISTANSCATITGTVTINNNSGLPTSLSSSNNPTCNGNCNGSATVAATAGTAPFTYSWSPSGGTSATGTSLCAGTTYTCTITDKNGCSGTQTVTLTQPTALAVTPTQTGTSCMGSNNGTATVSLSGGSPGYTYTWSPAPGGGQGTSNATGLAGGTTYTCTIHDSHNCSTTQSFTITQPTALSVIPTQTNSTCNGNNNGTATAGVSGGTPGYTYTWSPAPGGGQGTSTATGLAGGTTYTCTIHDANNCTTTQTFSITQPSPLSVNPNQMNANCNGSNSGSATANVSGGTPGYTYTWSPAPGGGQGTSTATGLSGGTTYTCTIHDANNCSTTQTFTITQPSSLSVIPGQTNVNCNGANSGTANVSVSGGASGYTYTWSPAPGGGQGSATATGLAGGTTYTCTVHDANNCSITQTFTITQPAPLTETISGSNAGCGASTGTANVTAGGGSPSYTYTWSPAPGAGQGTANVSGLASGTYTCTIHDASNCSIAQTVAITSTGGPSTTLASQTNPACNAACNGTAGISASGGTGPYTYTWSPAPGAGQGTPNVSALCAGTYTCTVNDANNCNTFQTVTINQPSALTITPAQTNVNCNGANNGTATASTSGGTAGYTYTWSPAPGGGQGTSSPTGLTGGTAYTCIVHDANNCSSSQTFTITQPAVLTESLISTQTGCGTASGSASASVGGGTPGYSYTWSPAPGSGQGTANASGLAAGTYTCQIHDANSCTSSQTVTITTTGGPSASVISQSNLSCNSVCNGSADIIASGGNGPYSFTWNPAPGSGQGTANASALCAGTYTCTVNDANNCSTYQTVNINQPVVLSANVSPTDVTCNGANNGAASVTPAGGTPSYTYSWSPAPGGGQGTSAVTGLTGSTTYTCIVSDANGCSITQTFLISQPSALAGSITSTPATCGQSNG